MCELPKKKKKQKKQNTKKKKPNNFATFGVVGYVLFPSVIELYT